MTRKALTRSDYSKLDLRVEYTLVDRHRRSKKQKHHEEGKSLSADQKSDYQAADNKSHAAQGDMLLLFLHSFFFHKNNSSGLQPLRTCLWTMTSSFPVQKTAFACSMSTVFFVCGCYPYLTFSLGSPQHSRNTNNIGLFVAQLASPIPFIQQLFDQVIIYPFFAFLLLC